jgi:hypothetical protein
MADEPEYTELFIITFEGTVKILKERLNNLDIIEHYSLNRPGFRLSSTTEFTNKTDIHADIKYNTYQTDRTQIATQIEEINGVSEVTLG